MDCYLHVLTHLLDYDGGTTAVCGSYNSTLGTTVNNLSYLGGMGRGSSDGGDTSKNDWAEMSDALNDKLSDGSEARVCDGIDDWNKKDEFDNHVRSNRFLDNTTSPGKFVFNAGAITENPDGSYSINYANFTAEQQITVLRSDWVISDTSKIKKSEDGAYYYIDEQSAFSLKSLKQKAIDLYDLIENHLSDLSSGEKKETLLNFTNGDMQPVEPPEDPGSYVPPEPMEYEEDLFLDWLDYEALPEPVPPEEPIVNDKINDKAKGQWYVNLWYAMDGSNISDIVKTAYTEESNFDYWTVQNQEKTTKQEQKVYVVMDDKLAGDASWIQFALTNAIVTMKQAALRTTDNITWEGVEYLSTSDIKEVDDSKKIAKAEAEYKKTLAQIQAEDKQFDIQLKKLDTEHSALKAEVDSIKNVMSKNIEKSFTAFS